MSVVDLLLLGVSYKQSRQLESALEQLQHIQAEALDAAIRKQALDTLREFVFNVGQNLLSLEPYLEISPKAVYVTANLLDKRFKDYGISSALFPDFADKEYIQKVQDNLTTLIQLSFSKLPPQEAEEAVECVDAVVDMPNLNKAITDHDTVVAAQAAKQQLKETEEEWVEVSRKQSMKFKIAGGMIFGGILSALLLITSLPIVPLILIFFGVITLFVPIKRYAELSALRKDLQKKVAKASDSEQYTHRYNSDWDDLVGLRNRREQVIFSVMGQVPGYKNLLPSPNSSDVESSDEVPHIIKEPGKSAWICSNCGKNVRYDALTCKWCGITFEKSR